MGLVKCKDCQHECSDMAEKCPNCGATISTWKGVGRDITLILFMILAIGLIGLIDWIMCFGS